MLGKFRRARAAIESDDSVMKAKAKNVAHKLGANPKEPAVKSHRRDPNFKQSRDVHEDRGERQIKMGGAARNVRG
jgi:hypothetical protein